MAYSLKYSYNSSSQSYSVSGYSNITTSDKVVIPNTYNNGTNGSHPVTSIGNRAFQNCSSLTSVTIGNGVTRIGDYAFYNCSSLTSVTIPDSVTSIGPSAFTYCSSLTSVTIPNSVITISSSAFAYCTSLTSVTIPDSVTSIDPYVFANCSSLKQLILFPSTPPNLSSNAIPTTVQSIYVQQSSKAAYQAAEDWVAYKTKIVSDNIYLSFAQFNQKNKEYIDKKINDNWNEFNLANGTGTGSLVQKRLKSDGVTWTTTKAYQGASTALGGGTQAGRTEEEFNAYFWDSAKNVPLNGGRGKDSNGNILDNLGLTYTKSYSFGLAEGEVTKALGRGSHSEGYYTETEGEYSHAEGWKTVSRGLGSHAEGDTTQTIGNFSHAEGFGTSAKGAASHAEGMSTVAIGEKSHVEGFATRALETYQHVEGVYNADNANALHIVGNGTSENARKNAFVVLKDGRAKVQTAPTESNDVLRWQEKLALETKINNFISNIFTKTNRVYFTKSDSFGTGLWFMGPGVFRVKAKYTYGSESGTDILIFSVSETYNSSSYNHNYEIKVLKNGDRVVATSDRQGSGTSTSDQMQWIYFYSSTGGGTQVTNWKYEELNLADLGTIS